MSIVECIDVTRTYGSGEAMVTALDNVSLRVENGEFVAIMGPSGCGKSTLLNLIGGLDRPTSGTVVVDGADITALDDTRLTELRRRRMGFVFQFFNLIPVLNAVENAALPLTLDGVKPEEARRRAEEWLHNVGLENRLNSRPDQLSGGQQQRVAVARALVAEPALILADEPTGNLDSRSSEEIATLLHGVSYDFRRAIVMVTHDPRIAAYADRIVFLKDGRIIDDTRISETHTVNEARSAMERAGLL